MADCLVQHIASTSGTGTRRHTLCDTPPLDARPGGALISAATPILHGDHLRILGEFVRPARDGASEQEQITTMIDGLLRRGIDDGTLRGDISVDELRFLLGSLLQAAARMAAEHQADVEKAAALITSVFLHGTRSPETSS